MNEITLEDLQEARNKIVGVMFAVSINRYDCAKICYDIIDELIYKHLGLEQEVENERTN